MCIRDSLLSDRGRGISIYHSFTGSLKMSTILVGGCCWLVFLCLPKLFCHASPLCILYNLYKVCAWNTYYWKLQVQYLHYLTYFKHCKPILSLYYIKIYCMCEYRNFHMYTLLTIGPHYFSQLTHYSMYAFKELGRDDFLQLIDLITIFKSGTV